MQNVKRTHYNEVALKDIAIQNLKSQVQPVVKKTLDKIESAHNSIIKSDSNDENIEVLQREIMSRDTIILRLKEKYALIKDIVKITAYTKLTFFYRNKQLLQRIEEKCKEIESLNETINKLKNEINEHITTINAKEDEIKLLNIKSKEQQDKIENQRKDIIEHKMTENVLKNSVAELKKEKRFWELKREVESDEVGMNVSLSGPLFRLNHHHSFYRPNDMPALGVLTFPEGKRDGIYLKSHKDISQTLNTLSLLQTNGSLTEYFHKEIAQNKEEERKKEEFIKTLEKMKTQGMKADYGFPRSPKLKDDDNEGSQSERSARSDRNHENNLKTLEEEANNIKSPENRIDTPSIQVESPASSKNKPKSYIKIDIPLDKIYLSRPNFISFIEDEIYSGNILQNRDNPINKNNKILFEQEKEKLIKEYKTGMLEIEYDPPYKEWLFVTIRAIYDCKFNEHFLKQDSVIEISTLADFTFSWLGNFCVDKSQRGIRQLEFYEMDRANDIRMQLLLGLRGNQEIKMWEYATFIDFLEERHSTDELHFFLQARRCLFGGSQLDNATSRHERIHLVSMERVISTIK